jgi:uncharacterized membrane protein YfcA
MNILPVFKKPRAKWILAILLLALAIAAIPSGPAQAAAEFCPPAAAGAALPWWGWPILLFVFCALLGVIAVLAGVGGGVLFVPIVGSFFPFHMDFVRGAGLLVAMCSSLAAAPHFLRKGMANLHLALPAALIASTASIAGAWIGLALPQAMIQITLGIAILGVVALLSRNRQSAYPVVGAPGRIAAFLQLQGSYWEPAEQRQVEWHAHHAGRGLLWFILIGFLAGMFGLGAGWANVPVLNLVMGAPLKTAVATSHFLLSITDASAAWVYINKGAIMPIIVVPSVLGIMLGSFLGAKLFTRVHPKSIRTIVLIMLTLAGLRSILKGCGI